MNYRPPFHEVVRDVLVKCDQCKQQNKLKNFLSERRLVDPHSDVTEGFMICPDCGLETHIYYLSDWCRNERTKITYQINKLAVREGRVPESVVRQIESLRKEYNFVYDRDQTKYRQLLEKAAIQDAPGE